MKNYRKQALFLGDLLSFIAGFFLFALIVYGTTRFMQGVTLHALPLAILTVIWIAVFFIFNFYDIQKSKPNLIFLRNFFIAGLIMLGIGFIFFYINPVTKISPKTNLLIFEGVSLALILGWRRLFYSATSNIFRSRFAIVCSDERHQTLVDEVSKNPHLGFICVGTYLTLADFHASNVSVDMLIIHKTAMEETELLEKTLASNIDVIDLAEAYENILYKIPVNFINSNWVIHSIKKQGDFFYYAISRIISIVFAIVVLIVTSPICLAIMIAMKIEDGGPIIFKNDRVGLNGKVFYLYKFRSMIVNAEKNGAEWAKVNDSRITKVGAITRKLHVDEIPQMINLLKGDLTLVGPRPERPDFVADLEKQIPYYFMRHTIKPGFTGWAQIKFRYARTIMDSQEKFEYDLYYIKNRNFFLDIGIILKTAQIVFTHLE
jgi:exopolysaccharide biosynthesis polyprenyl glycosylphosphotransferase